MPKQIEYDGTLHEFPDDFTDGDIAAALAQGDQARAIPDAPREGAPSVLGGIANMGAGFVKSAGRSVQALGDLPHMVGLPGLTDATDAMYGLPEGASKQSMESSNPAQKVGGALETAVEMAPTIGATKAAPGVLAKAGGFSKVRAVENFDKVAAAANKVPVDVNAAGNIAFKIKKLKDDFGAKGVPQVVNKFISYVTDPTKAPLNYEDARQFYSTLTRLSVNERNAMSGVVKYEVGNLTRAMNEAITQAAGTVGKGEQYVSAMKEYARHMTVAKKAPKIAKIATAGAASSAGAAGAYSLIQRLLGK